MNAPTLWMAPLADVTDSAFRAMAFACGADRCTTAMVSASALVRGDPEAPPLLERLPEERGETYVQLHGSDPGEMEEAARKIHEAFGCSVLVKGGHNVNDASDFLYGKNEKGEVIAKWFRGRRISNPNTHGTGCTLSSAIAANLAKGESLEKAVENAKEYISGALEAMLDLGKGSGPLMHNFAIVKK